MIDEYAKMKDYTVMERIQELYTKLRGNAAEIDNLYKNMDRLEKDCDDIYILEDLYKNEFYLCMKNIGLYNDLLLNIDRLEKTIDNEFEIARIKKDALNFVRAESVDI